jgi:glycerol kinase
MLFDREARQLSIAQRELRQHYPAPGWVEHDPEEIWQATIEVARAAIGASGVDPSRIAGIGIANQRETVVVWDRSTGEPVHRAIVWQDRRTARDCARLKEEGTEAMVRERTGLLLDPYFSATKIAWILDHVPGARARAERGELACGTIDCFLLWRLTGGKVHATEITNAARTLLFDIHRQRWDSELCRLFNVPVELLPDVRGNSEIYGTSATDLFGRRLPIAGMAGDQQAALIGQACFRPGMAKSTYGTGCFMLVNTGVEAVASSQRLLTTPAYRIAGETSYALEGSIFVAGAAVKWLRDQLGVIADASETESMATQVADNRGVYMVPAFTGLGAPYWEPDARAAIYGLTLDTTGAHLARAALEAVAYQILDMVAAMAAD